MRPEDLVFWLDHLTDDSRTDHGVLCRRHADTMVVPRNWTLDDLREPDLHLFRPPSVPARKPRRSRRDQSTRREEAEQLALGGVAPEPEPPTDARPDSDTETDTETDTDNWTGGAAGAAPDQEMGAASDLVPGDVALDAAGQRGPWAPTFDAHDDLDGLLAARSPLLARAFRGDDRPRRSAP